MFLKPKFLDGLARHRRLKLGIALCVALLLFAFFLKNYQTRGLSLQTSPAFYRFNVIFGGDIPRVIDDITNAAANHYRTKVHPLFVLFANPEGSRLAHEMGSGPAAASTLTAAMGAGCVSLMLAYLLLLGCGLPEATLVAILFGYSTSQMVWSSVPETFAFGTIALLVTHILGLSALRFRKWPRTWSLLLLPLAGVLALGTTTTNVVQALVVFGVVAWSIAQPQPWPAETRAPLRQTKDVDRTHPPRPLEQPHRSMPHQTHGRSSGRTRVALGAAWLAAAVVITFAVSLQLSHLQQKLYPSSVLFYQPEAYNGEQLYTHWENLQKPVATAGTLGRVFGLYSIVAPPPNLVPIPVPETTAIVFQDSSASKYTAANWLALSTWGLLVTYGLYAGWKFMRRILVTLMLCIGANLALHSVYGTDEAFLYAGHIVFLFFGIVGLGLAQLRRGHPSSQAPIVLVLGALVGYVAVNNTAFMDRIEVLLAAL